MDNWQPTLVVPALLALGVLIAGFIMLAVAFRRVRREIATLGMGMARTLAHLEVVSGRVEVLFRGFASGETSIAEAGASVVPLARGLERRPPSESNQAIPLCRQPLADQLSKVSLVADRPTVPEAPARGLQRQPAPPASAGGGAPRRVAFSNLAATPSSVSIDQAAGDGDGERLPPAREDLAPQRLFHVSLRDATDPALDFRDLDRVAAAAAVDPRRPKLVRQVVVWAMGTAAVLLAVSAGAAALDYAPFADGVLASGEVAPAALHGPWMKTMVARFEPPASDLGPAPTADYPPPDLATDAADQSARASAGR